VSILAEFYRTAGIETTGRTIHRTAVRAVILCGRKLLMIYSAKVGDYKFPGGGVDAGESHEQALAREVREECGTALVEFGESLGAVIEYAAPIETDFDVFRMISHYYFCRAGDDFGAQKLDEYERDLGFQPVWVDIDLAISTNRSLLDSQSPPDWLRREIFVLEHIRRLL